MKIKYKLKEMKPNSAGMPDRGEGSRYENVGLEECGCDICQGKDEYGMSQSGNPDRDGDGVYSPLELYYHFDLNTDGEVLPDEYEQHVKWHERNPEVFEINEEALYEKKDRCYHLAKQKYDVFPSAYASGFIVRCRKGKVSKKKA